MALVCSWETRADLICLPLLIATPLGLKTEDKTLLYFSNQREVITIPTHRLPFAVVQVHRARLQLLICPSLVLLQQDRAHGGLGHAAPPRPAAAAPPASSLSPTPSHRSGWSPVGPRRRELRAEGKQGAGTPLTRCQTSSLAIWGWAEDGGSSVGAPCGTEGNNDAAAGGGCGPEQRGQARHSSQPGHTEEACPAGGCRPSLPRILQVCTDCTTCSSPSHRGSSEVTAGPTQTSHGSARADAPVTQRGTPRPPRAPYRFPGCPLPLLCPLPSPRASPSVLLLKSPDSTVKHFSNTPTQTAHHHDLKKK